MPNTVYILGDDALHPDVLVKTTHEEIKGVIESYEKDGLARCHFPQIWANIKKVNTDELWATGSSKQLANFNNDILLFYVCRYVLFKKPIPLVEKHLVDETKLNWGTCNEANPNDS